MVPGEGFEPSRGLPRRILSAVRLPFRHPGRWNSAKFTPLSLPQDLRKSPESLGTMLSFRPDLLTRATSSTPQETISAWLSTPLPDPTIRPDHRRRECSRGQRRDVRDRQPDDQRTDRAHGQGGRRGRRPRRRRSPQGVRRGTVAAHDAARASRIMHRIATLLRERIDEIAASRRSTAAKSSSSRAATSPPPPTASSTTATSRRSSGASRSR